MICCQRQNWSVHMINIGICDDESRTCRDLSLLIEDWSRKHGIQVHVITWLTGTALCSALEQHTTVDLLFLDIEMAACSGLDAGYFIRDILCNLSIRIVFISHVPSHATQLFDYQPLHFLVKPITPFHLDRVFQLYFRSVGSKEACFTFQRNNQIVEYPFSNIVLLGSMNRKVKVTLVNGEDEYYGKLKDCMQKLPVFFIQIHQSFIVNMNYVYSFTYETVTLYSQQVLSISKPYRKAVRDKLLKWGMIRNG
jgi:DNA-binding LytR/AlgR family response regulator